MPQTKSAESGDSSQADEGQVDDSDLDALFGE